MRLLLGPRVNARACLLTGRVTGALREPRATNILSRGGCAHALVHWAPGVKPFSFRIESFWGHCLFPCGTESGGVGCALDIFRAFSRTREAAALNLLEGSFPRTEEKQPLSLRTCRTGALPLDGLSLVNGWSKRGEAEGVRDERDASLRYLQQAWNA